MSEDRGSCDKVVEDLTKSGRSIRRTMPAVRMAKSGSLEDVSDATLLASLTLDDGEKKVKAHIKEIKAQLRISALEDEQLAEKEQWHAGRRMTRQDGSMAEMGAAMMSKPMLRYG